MRTLGIIISCFISQLAFSQVDWEKFKQADTLIQAKRYDEAVVLYSQMLQVDSNVYGAWYNRGVCFYKMEQYQYAKYDLYKAVNLVQTDPQLFDMIGSIHMFEEDWRNTVLFKNEALKLGYKDSVNTFAEIGSAYYFLGINDSAVYFLEKSLSLGNQTNLVITNLGFVYLETNPKRSCTMFKMAHEQEPENPNAVNNLGYSYYLCGDLEMAYAQFEQSKKMNPDNSWVYRNIGLYHKAKGEQEQACEALAKAIELNFIQEWGDQDLKELMKYCQP